MAQPVPAPADQPVVALAAVPAGSPPAQAEPPADWRDDLGASWRPASLAAGLVIAAGFLFWRLGARARHGGQEPALAGHFEQEPAYPAEELPLLSLINAGHAESPEESNRRAARPHRQFATLREALAAMEAHRMGKRAPERKQVDA